MEHYNLGNNIGVYHGIENTAMLSSRQSEAPRDLAQGRRGALASVATAARYDSAACDEGEVYLPQRSVL